MYFLLFLVVLVIVYIKSFRDNFTAETIDKITPVLFIVSIVVISLSIISSLIR